MTVVINPGPSATKLEHVRAFIDKQQQRRQSNKVLHGHPSPVFWLDREVPIHDVMRQRRVANRVAPKRINLYVATPYCLPTNPDRCGFCLFPSEVYQGRDQLDQYLTYLEREGQMYRQFLGGTMLGNIYFGGGTSNLYKPDQYGRLLTMVARIFGRIPSDSEVTLEGIPQLFTREKLAAMKDAGINRVSIGVQQLDDSLIKFSGRKQKATHVFQTLEWCAELGLASSVDMIFGWPRQTIGVMLAGLQRIVDVGVPHITHYELNVAGRTDFARNRRHELPSPQENLLMYRVARDFLESHGYRQVTAYDWAKRSDAKRSRYAYEQTWHEPLTSTDAGQISGVDLWGWGFAAVSFFLGTPAEPGWVMMNSPRVDDYFHRLDQGEFPVERGFHYTVKDLRLTVLFQMLQAMQVDLSGYRRIFDVDLVDEYSAIWQALVERDWIEITQNHLALVGDGVFYTPLIQGLLAHDRMEELRRTRSPIELAETYA
jgi:oxygen-independent coproporphyrinogen-3 oxidase